MCSTPVRFIPSKVATSGIRFDWTSHETSELEVDGTVVFAR